MQKKLIINLLFILFVIVPCIGQNNNNICTTCGPKGANLENKRENIENGKEIETPYNGIFHLKVTRAFFSTNVSTASFIKNYLVITANHNVMYSPLITKIEFFINGKWIKIKKKDLKIFHYHNGLFHKRRKDIALIKIENLDILRKIEHTNFNPQIYEEVKGKGNLTFHLTGFPCDKPNILVDKKTSSSALSMDSTNKIIGYEELYTCTGDSGAPLWFKSNDKYYLISIHHGGNDIGAFGNKTINIGVKITSDVLKWINEKK